MVRGCGGARDALAGPAVGERAAHCKGNCGAREGGRVAGATGRRWKREGRAWGRAYVQADGADEVADPPDAGRADLAPRSARGQMTVHLEKKGPQWRGWALGEGT